MLVKLKANTVYKGEYLKAGSEREIPDTIAGDMLLFGIAEQVEEAEPVAPVAPVEEKPKTTAKAKKSK